MKHFILILTVLASGLLFSHTGFAGNDAIQKPVTECESIEMAYDFKIEELNVQFNCKSQGEFDKVVWDFGDGTTSTDKNPTHKYKKSGTYEFTLTTYNSKEGCSKKTTGKVYAFSFDE